jgi:hypothetical protein
LQRCVQTLNCSACNCFRSKSTAVPVSFLSGLNSERNPSNAQHRRFEIVPSPMLFFHLRHCRHKSIQICEVCDTSTYREQGWVMRLVLWMHKNRLGCPGFARERLGRSSYPPVWPLEGYCSLVELCLCCCYPRVMCLVLQWRRSGRKDGGNRSATPRKSKPQVNRAGDKPRTGFSGISQNLTHSDYTGYRLRLSTPFPPLFPLSLTLVRPS